MSDYRREIEIANDQPAPEKTCHKCGTKWTPNPNHAPRHNSICPDCKREQKREWVKRNAEHVKQYQETYRVENAEQIRESGRAWRDKNLEHVREYQREYHRKDGYSARYHAKVYAANPEKVLARQAVSKAIKKGQLERLPCERCGAINTQAHHEDYSMPYTVRWLCVKCHAETHRQLAQKKDEEAQRWISEWTKNQ